MFEIDIWRVDKNFERLKDSSDSKDSKDSKEESKKECFAPICSGESRSSQVNGQRSASCAKNMAVGRGTCHPVCQTAGSFISTMQRRHFISESHRRGVSSGASHLRMFMAFICTSCSVKRARRTTLLCGGHTGVNACCIILIRVAETKLSRK